MASRGGLESSGRCLSQSGAIKFAPIGMGCSDKHTVHCSSCSAPGPPGSVRVGGALRRRSSAPHLCPSRPRLQFGAPAPPTSAPPGTACNSAPPATLRPPPLPLPAPPAVLRPRAPHLCTSGHRLQLCVPAAPTSAPPGTACSPAPPRPPPLHLPAPPAVLRPRGPRLCTSRPRLQSCAPAPPTSAPPGTACSSASPRPPRLHVPHRLQLCVPARGTPVARTSAPLHPLAAVAPAPFPPAPGPPSAQDPGAGRPGLALHHPRRVRPRHDQGPTARATPAGGGPEMATRAGARSSESHQRCQLSDSRGFPDALGSSFVVLGEMELFRHIWERDWEWGGMVGSRVEFWTRISVVGLDWATGGHQVALSPLPGSLCHCRQPQVVARLLHEPSAGTPHTFFP
ncbi:uncharacterized protein LOC123851990 [Mirounga angustirostris]|uniref:uncharacterized protein LOC123851990 n=1 Tax=Mirounga angustirostris TaxID=9716 RepID=UPI00313B7676